MWENLCLQLMSHSPSEASPTEEALSEGKLSATRDAVFVLMGAIPPSASDRCWGSVSSAHLCPGIPLIIRKIHPVQ